MGGKVEKEGKTIQQQLAETVLKGTKTTEIKIYDEEGGTCSFPPLVPPASMAKKWKGKVMITFSPLGFMTLRSCGIDKIEESKDGNSYYAEKCIDVLEWIYGGADISVNMSKEVKPINLDNYIFVNCGGINGKEYAFNNPSIMGMRESELMEKLEYAVRQLKFFLSNLESGVIGETKYIVGGKVKIYICAFQPFDCLLFALQKVLGFSLEKKILENKIPINPTDNSKKRIELSDGYDKDQFYRKFYSGFLERACKNPVLKDAKKWFKDHQWRFQLEACEVHQLYYESIIRLTKKGMFHEKIDKISRLMSTLEETTKEFMEAYKSGTSRGPVDLNIYKSWVISWQSQKKPIIHEKNLKQRKDGVMERYDMDWPAVEYEGKLYSYYGLERLAKEEKKKYQNEIDYARRKTVWNSKSDIEKLSNEIKEKELKLYNETAEKFKIINELLFKLGQKRKNSQWASFESSSYTENDVEYVKYNGKLLNEEQLRAEFDDLVEYHREQSRKISKLYQQICNIYKAVRDDNYDTITKLQIGLTIGGFVLAVVYPPSLAASICFAAELAMASIQLESMKWKLEEDHSNKNMIFHYLSYATDFISVVLAPLGAYAQSIRLLKGAKGAAKADELGDLAKGAAKNPHVELKIGEKPPKLFDDVVTDDVKPLTFDNNPHVKLKIGEKPPKLFDDVVTDDVKPLTFDNNSHVELKIGEKPPKLFDDVVTDDVKPLRFGDNDDFAEELLRTLDDDTGEVVLKTPTNLSLKTLGRAGSEVVTQVGTTENIALKQSSLQKNIGERMINKVKKINEALLREDKPANRLLNAFGYDGTVDLWKEYWMWANLYSTKKIIFESAYLVLNTGVNANNLKSIVDGVGYIRESVMNPEIEKEINPLVCQEIRKRLLEEN